MGADPDQFTNLAEMTDYASVRKQLDSDLDARLQEKGIADTGKKRRQSTKQNR